MSAAASAWLRPSQSSCQRMPFPGSPPQIPGLCHPAEVASAPGRGQVPPCACGAVSWAHPLVNAGLGVGGGRAEDTVITSLLSSRVHGLQQETRILLRRSCEELHQVQLGVRAAPQGMCPDLRA